MRNENKQAVISAIWNNPAPVFGGEWRQTRSAWEYLRGDRGPRGCIRLLQHSNGDGVTVMFNHGSGRAGEQIDVFDFLSGEYGTGGFFETLKAAADRYGLTLEFTKEQREQVHRNELARIIAPVLVEALRNNQGGAAGRYLRETRRLDITGHFGELTAESLSAAREHLKQSGIKWERADFDALGLTEWNACNGYNVVLPYITNGIVRGFMFRNTNPAPSGPKILKSADMGQPGYCERLEPGRPVIAVEGELDAVRLIQQGVRNVLAIGGQQTSDKILKLITGRGIREIVYIPDNQTDADGKRELQYVRGPIKAFQNIDNQEGSTLFCLSVADLPTPTVPNGKNDADSWGADHPDGLPGIIAAAVPAWKWEIDHIDTDAPAKAVQDAITDIYTRNADPYERERMRQYIAGREDLRRAGVTPQALDDIGAQLRASAYRDSVTKISDELSKAVQGGADAETVGKILRRFQAVQDEQGADTRAEWDRQLNETFDDELDAVRTQPETLKTNWILGNIDKSRQFRPYQTVEFYPADIAVFCAATSHGKTAIMFQAAIDLVRKYTEKTFLFVSCEENKRQLLERALSVYIPFQNTDTGTDEDGSPCFYTGTRKKTIKAALMGTAEPTDGTGGFPFSLDERLKNALLRQIDGYGRNIRPRLKFVHSEATAERICANIIHYVEQYRAQGVDVGAVFVDYVQLLTTDARNFSRTDELKAICKALKDCAARTELPVIVAAQLNREVFRAATNAGTPFDNVSVANIGEGADIERIAHDIYFVWNTDKTPLQWYAGKSAGNYDEQQEQEPQPDRDKVRAGVRSRRLFQSGQFEILTLKTGYLYVEQLKARDGKTGGWGLLPFDGERGTVGPTDYAAMLRY